MAVKQISVQELDNKLKNGEQLHLIDVREPFERDIATLGGELVPLGTIPQNLDCIPRHGLVVFYCRSGARSEYAIEYLQTQGYTNLVNLEGGILAWAEHIDPSITTY